MILIGQEDGLFSKETMETLKLNVLMLKISFGMEDFNEIMTSLSNLNQRDDYEIIESLKSIENLLKNTECDLLENETYAVITQYVVGMSSHKEIDVRYYAMRILFILCKSPFNITATMQISKMMDNENEIVKKGILERHTVLKQANKEIAQLVKQKGEVDNHYLIREIARKIKD